METTTTLADDTGKCPVISIIMPVYNSALYLSQALDSVLAQTFHDFELLVIDDGSTDDSRLIINTYCQQDARITLLQCRHRGLIDTLNDGFSLARGKYLARLDSDDLAVPSWLAKIVDFMNSHDEIGICGANVQTFDARRNLWVLHYPTEHEAIRCHLLFNSVISNGNVFLRRSVVQQFQLYFDKNYPHAEDYELWVRASKLTTLANIPLVLTRVRLHDKQVSSLFSSIQHEGSLRISHRQLAELGLEVTAHELELHAAVIGYTVARTSTLTMMTECEVWLQRILQANESAQLYQPTVLREVVSMQWMHYCARMARLGMGAWQIYQHSSLSNSVLPKQVKLFIRCLLRRG